MRPPHLIVVDDEAAMRSLLTRLARIALPSAQISDHASAEGALQAIEIEGADLLITDCKMLGMDGPEFVRTLREKNFTMPIIMVSSSDDARVLGEEAGINEFIEKRYLTDHLGRAIQGLLNAA
jgi:DNA-binding response OmpR family regulator